MIITRAMPTQQTAIIGVSRRITAGQEFKAGLCRAPAASPVLTGVNENTPIGVVSWGPDRIDVFGLGTDDAMYHLAWDGHAWSDWEPRGGKFHNP